MADERIIIAGGGIAGIASALALARAGRPSLVLEKSKAFEEVGAGVQLGPNAVRALQRVGAFDAVAPQCVTPEALVIGDGLTGKPLKEVPLGETFTRRFGAPYRVIHRAHLLAGLLGVARASPLIELQSAQAVTEFEETAGGVTVRLANRSSRAGAGLVGADGVRSTVRRQLLDDGEPEPSGLVFYRAVMPVAEAQRLTVNLWLCPGAHLVTYPLDRGRLTNIVAIIHAPDAPVGWRAPATHEEVLSHWRRVAAPLRDLIARAPAWTKWLGADRTPVPRWSKGKVTLAGDAAHATLPFLAQGAAMAIEDGAALGEAVSAAPDIATAFRAYEQARLERTARIVLRSREQGRINHLRGWRRHARNLAIRRMSPEKFLDRLAWIYEHGSQRVPGLP